MNNINLEKIYKLSEVAKLTGLSAQTLRKHYLKSIEKGKPPRLKGFKDSKGAPWRVTESELERFQKARKNMHKKR